MIARTIAFCLAGTFIYATLRYHVFGSSDWAQLPLWTTNKAVSFSSVILLAAAYLTRDKHHACRYGLAGFALAVLHVAMSMPLISPAYYTKLYSGARLSWTGELCLLGGCVAAVLLLAPAVTSVPAIRAGMQHADWLSWQRTGYIALAFTVLHVAALGMSGWVQPHTWPGWMPPITLLSTAVTIAPLIRKALRSAAGAPEMPSLHSEEPAEFVAESGVDP